MPIRVKEPWPFRVAHLDITVNNLRVQWTGSVELGGAGGRGKHNIFFQKALNVFLPSRIIDSSIGSSELLLVPFGFLAKWAVRLFDKLWFNDLFDSVISLAKFVLVQGFRFLLKILLCFYSFICWSLAIILTCWHYISIDTDTDLIWPRKWMIHPARRKLPWL